MENVVKKDDRVGEPLASAEAKKPRGSNRDPSSDRKRRSGNAISAPRNSSRPPPTSVRLHEDELKALKVMAAAQGSRSVSDLIQRAVRDFISGQGGFEIPSSLGVVEGVYGATIHDDVVELANQLRLLEFGLLRVADLLPPSDETSRLRRMFEDASRTMTRIAGSVVYKHTAPAGAKD